MSHHRRHLVEQVQVIAAAAAALIVTYSLSRPAAAPWNNAATTGLLPSGAGGGLTAFVLATLAVAAGCAALTATSRPEGALLATLAGVAGFGLRAAPMRELLWHDQADAAGLFGQLVGGVVLMAGVLLAAFVVILGVRAVIGALLPRWSWTDPLAETPRFASGPRSEPARRHYLGWAAALYEKLQAYGRRTNPVGPLSAIGAVLMELAIALVLLVLTFRSTDRGQVYFALAASFLVGALAAHQTFPTRSTVAFFLAPLALPLAVFLIPPGSANSGGGPAWLQALEVAHGIPLRAALPVDWLAFGCGGAVAGVWISRRLRETRQLQSPQGGEETGKSATPGGARG